MRRIFSAFRPALQTLLQHRYTAYEWAAITCIGLLYMGLLFSHQSYSGEPRENLALTGLAEDYRIINIEHERLSGILIPVSVGLEKYGQIPTWNPYLSGGVPLVNNAFNYLFNPFASLPFLLLGPVQGGKIALMIGLLISGYSTWALAKVIGLGGLARVTTAALYMLSGAIIGKFHVGHFQLGLSLAWVPLVLAGLWWTLKSEDRRAPVLMAVAFALLFFSGNIYYSLHTLISCAVITLAYAFSREDQRWRVRWDRLRRVMIGGAFAVGLSALFFLPVWTVRAFVSHPGDPELVHRYPMFQAFANYVLPYEVWGELENPHLGLMVVVDYAYIGPMVFFLIGFMGVMSLFRREQQARYRRSALIALALALAMMVWGAGQSGLLQSLYANIPLLAQFRYVGRAHAIAALWWIVLAGISLDVLWRMARELLLPPDVKPYRERTALILVGGIAVGLWLWLLVYSAGDNLTRLQLAFMDLNIYRYLNDRSFLHLSEGIDQFWRLFILLMAFLLTLRFIKGGMLHLLNGNQPLWWRQGLVSALRFGVIVLALVGIADVLQANGRLLNTSLPVIHNYVFYPEIFKQERDPIPALHESYSPAAYESYQDEVRNWSLNEGWTALPVYGELVDSEIQNMPRWAVISTEFVDGEFASRFLEGQNTVLWSCSEDLSTYGECDLSMYGRSALYQLQDTLPYAFVVNALQLRTDAASIRLDDIYPVQVIAHQQDTITLRATLPEAPGPYMLIVKEINFPGWQASVNDVPVLSQTVGPYIGIQLADGTQTYTLRYQPPSLAAGLLVSLVTLLVVGFYLRGPIKKAASVPETAFNA